GIFWKRANRAGAISGMSIGLTFTFIMIALMRAQNVLPGLDEPVIEHFLGISAQGIGMVGMLLNFAVTIVVSLLTEPPPKDVMEMVEHLRDAQTEQMPAPTA